MAFDVVSRTSSTTASPRYTSGRHGCATPYIAPYVIARRPGSRYSAKRAPGVMPVAEPRSIEKISPSPTVERVSAPKSTCARSSNCGSPAAAGAGTTGSW
jgi:hypothetical protein